MQSKNEFLENYLKVNAGLCLALPMYARYNIVAGSDFLRCIFDGIKRTDMSMLIHVSLNDAFSSKFFLFYLH